MTIGSVSPEDAKRFSEWVWAMRGLNMFDPSVISYPRTVMLRASNEADPLLFVPLQSVLMFDSIAPKPGLSPRQEALCLRRIDQKVESLAKDSQHREVYFICRDDRVADLCARHGYEEIKDVRILRKKIVVDRNAEQGEK